MDPETWEQECLAEVRRLLYRDSIMTRDKVIHDIRLEGAHPDTKLIVDLAVRGDERTLIYEMWTDFEGVPGAAAAQDVDRMESPYHVGGLVEMWVGEEQ